MSPNASASKATAKLPPVPPVFLVNAALRLRRFFLRAADAVVPPYVALLDRFFGAATTMLLHSAAELRVADLLAKEPLSADEIAALSNTDPALTERLLWALVGVGVFSRNSDGKFINNRASTGLLTGVPGSVRGFVEFFGIPQIVDAWQELPNVLRQGGVGFDRVHGRGVWDWMSSSQVGTASFVEGMSSMTAEVASSIAAAYPFAEVRRLCDVGGGVGIVLAAALNRHPHLSGILFDEEAMLKQAPAHLEKHGVLDRVELSPGSFFGTIPRGADAYILKTVLHNWNDDNAEKILRNVRLAMDPGHRLLVADFVGGPNALSTLIPYMDMAGMLIYSGRERSEKQMSQLFERNGFRFCRLIPLPACQAIFEGVAVA